ncbi:MAG: SIR2 family protein [Thermoplasmata archaeon]|nr:MAG: SIR2 family protein [Thermoplasmata archaeon]
MDRKAVIKSLRTAHQNKSLTLYLGAGVSRANGLPTWEQLVLAMYYSRLREPNIGEGLRAYPNYLFSIAEWHLRQRQEPLDISARKIRSQFDSADEFLEELKMTLYAGFTYYDDLQTPYPGPMLEANPTLRAVTNLCKAKRGERALHAIVTYNYDSLLELALESKDIKAQSVWKEATRLPSEEALPIYHVHGYVPIRGDGSSAEELIFTEEQYHLASHDAYSWSNLVQIQCMSSSTGLMIGLSLSDRNMRRLLDAIQKTPIQTKNYALMQEPQQQTVSEDDIHEIDENARKYYERFARSGIKTDGRVFGEIQEIVRQVERFDAKANELILRELGVTPLWYKNHDDIPEIVASILR